MKEQIVLERTVTTENGRTVLLERIIYGVLDADGVFRLRGYWFIRKGIKLSKEKREW